MSQSHVLALRPRVSGLSSPIAWLRDRDVPVKLIADELEIKELYVRQLAYRGNWRNRQPGILPWLEAQFNSPADPFGTVSDEVRRDLGIRPAIESWTVDIRPPDRTRLGDLEERIEQFGTEFWDGVRFGVGLSRLKAMLIDVGRPARLDRVRAKARIRHLIAETYTHAGYSRSAITEGLAALLLWRAAHEQSHDTHDLEQYARTALIISQSHLLRQEPGRAQHFLDLYQAARNRIDRPLGGEYFRQRGAVAFQNGDDQEARRNFKSAMKILAETIEYGRPKEEHEVLNIGTRQMNLLTPVNWEDAQKLHNYMVKTLPPADIHISMNVNWAAACGFSIDSPAANRAASELLDRFRDTSVGFGHQATAAWLLKLTPALPARLRADWVRHALYENTFKDL